MKNIDELVLAGITLLIGVVLGWGAGRYLPSPPGVPPTWGEKRLMAQEEEGLNRARGESGRTLPEGDLDKIEEATLALLRLALEDIAEETARSLGAYTPTGVVLVGLELSDPSGGCHLMLYAHLDDLGLLQLLLPDQITGTPSGMACIPKGDST